MPDELESRVSALETRMAVMDVHHQENVRRLTVIEGLSTNNSVKLDTLLSRSLREDGASEQSAKYGRALVWIFGSLIAGGSFFEWLWPKK